MNHELVLTPYHGLIRPHFFQTKKFWSLVIKIIAQEIILKKPISQINISGYLRYGLLQNYFLGNNLYY